jgi:hypothetical protein
MKIVFITGIASWLDYKIVERFIIDIKNSFPELLIVSGDCKIGVDKITKNICIQNDINHESKPTNWKYGKNAIHLRNIKAILETKPEIIAFFGNDYSYPYDKYQIIKNCSKLMIHINRNNSKKYRLLERLY